ncbi:MAG: hypothetical protein OXO49_08405 [Gammaproteobacteria bacterium]|nr:hypothetical protein [Gammaproteobacteria bacterium]MDE0252965.1 hypothetical protein [Gammaproteobacteria bacterium]
MQTDGDRFISSKEGRRAKWNFLKRLRNQEYFKSPGEKLDNASRRGSDGNRIKKGSRSKRLNGANLVDFVQMRAVDVLARVFV